MRITGGSLVVATIVAAGMAGAAPALAQSRPGEGYPARPIRLIVPVAPGGSTDVVGRILASRLGDGLGQPMVVDNRPGAGGIIGSDIVAKAAPDGYTLVFAYASHSSSPSLYGKLPYDPVRDFTPIVQVASQPLILVVGSAVPADSVKELIALAKARPDHLSAGIATSGSAGHIALEMFKLATETRIVSIIYKGGAPAQVALMSGEVHLVFASTASTMPHLKSGRLKVLATAAGKRLPYLPDVPTLIEAGLKDYDVTAWQGLMGPAGLPDAIVRRLNAEVLRLLRQPDFIDRLAATGSDPVGGTPEEFAAKIRRELEQFGRVIRASGMRAG